MVSYSKLMLAVRRDNIILVLDYGERVKPLRDYERTGKCKMTEYYDVDRVVAYVEKRDGYIAVNNGWKRETERCDECDGSIGEFGECDYCGRVVDDGE